MTSNQNGDLHRAPVQAAALAENSNFNFVPSVTRDLALLQVSPELESAVLGLRRALTLKKFLTMKLSEPMFAPGSIQATARGEMMKLRGFNGTRSEASHALQAAIKKSKLYGRLGYWVTHRCYFSVFDIYKALLGAQHRNDLIVRDFKSSKRKNRRERDPGRLAEAKVARLSRWVIEARGEAALLREKASKLLTKADVLEKKAAADEKVVAHLKDAVETAATLERSAGGIS